MLRWMVAGLSIGSVCAVFAEEPETGERTPVVIEVGVSPDAPMRQMDGTRYETYLRTLLRGLAPKTPIISEGSGAHAATYRIIVRFDAGSTPQVVAVAFEVQAVIGGVRSTARELSSAVELPIGEPEAVEMFLRSEATRVVASGLLWQTPQLPKAPAATHARSAAPDAKQPARPAVESRRSVAHPAAPAPRRMARSVGTIAAGFGLSVLAAGVWQGMLARNAEAEFDAAATQVAAANAKDASERHAGAANALLASGTVIALAGAATVILDALGVIGRPRGKMPINDSTYPAVAIVPMPGGAIGMWSASFP